MCVLWPSTRSHSLSPHCPQEQTQGVYQPPNLSPSPTNLPPIPPSPNPLSSADLRRMPQSLPATPTSVRTFTDFSGEHKRLTTLHGSTGALEVSNLGGFKLGSTIAMSNGGSMNGLGGGGGISAAINGGVGNMHHHVAVGQGSVPVNGKLSGAFESSIDGFVKNGAMSTPTTPLTEFVPMVTPRTNGHAQMNGMMKTSPPNSGGALHAPISEAEEEISDVFTALSVKDPMIAAPGYGRGRSRRSSAPVNMSVQHLWGSVGGGGGEQGGEISHAGTVGGGCMGDLGGGDNFTNGRSSSTITSFNGWNSQTTLAPIPITAPLTPTPAATVSSIWSTGFQPAVTSQNSRPNSQTSSYSNSSEPGSSSLSAFSPIYSPTTNSTNGFFSHEPVSTAPSLLVSNALTNSVSMAVDQQAPSAFKVFTQFTLIVPLVCSHSMNTIMCCCTTICV